MTASEAINMPFKELLAIINNQLMKSDYLIDQYNKKTFIPLPQDDE